MGTKKSNKLYAAAAALAVTASAVAPGLTADAASKVTVKSVTNPASISHYGGYTFAVKKLSLPKTVKVLLSNKKYENRSVKWGKVSYDAKYIGKYQTISGTVSGTTKKASIKVKLNNYPVDVVEPKLAPVAVGEKLNLPSTIDVKYKDGKVIARSAKSFNLTAEKTDKAGEMKLSYNYMGKNSSIKGSIAYEVKAAEITNVMNEVKDDMLSVSADVKFPAKDAKAQLLIFPGKDESKALPAIDGKLENGKFTAEGKMIPAGTHSFSIKVGDVVSPAKEFMIEAPMVKDVKALNLKQVEVKLNKAVDKDTAVKTNFAITGGATVSSTEVSEDGKTIILNLAAPLVQKNEYTVSVTGLKTTAGVKLASYVKDITVEDTVAPKIVSANAVTKDDKVNSFTLKFSEPVSFTTIKVGDSILGASKVDDFTYTVSGKDLEVGKAYQVEVFGLTDLAGNKGGTPEVASILVSKDAVKPMYTINTVGPKSFEIKFDKDMSSAVAVDSIKVKDAKGNAVSLKALPGFKDDKRTLVVDLAALPFADATVNTATLDVTVQALQDKLGNVVEAKTSSVTLVRDTTKPEIKSAKFTKSNELEVEFSEVVTGVTNGDFFVNKTDGTRAATVSTVTQVPGTNKYTVVLDSSLKNGNYSLVLSVDAVADESANKNNAQSLLLVNDKETVTPVSPISATIIKDGVTSANKQVKITFDKSDVLAGINPVTGNLYADGADNKGLYSINGAALPQGAEVKFYDGGLISPGNDLTTGDEDAVVIDLSKVEAKDLVGAYAAFGNGGTATISVGGVKNVAGATLSLTSLPVAVADKTLPVVKESYITGNAKDGYKLNVKFSEAMKVVDQKDLILAGKDKDDAAVTSLTLGAATISSDGLSAEFAVTLGAADATKGFTLKTDVEANLASTTDKADNQLTVLSTPLVVTNFTTN